MCGWLAGWLADMQYSEPGITLSPLAYTRVGTQTVPSTETLARFLQRQRQHVRTTFGRLFKSTATSGLPWWHSRWESTGQCRGMGSIPGPGRFHTPRSNEARAPRLLKSVLHNPRPPQPEEAPEPHEDPA